MKIECVRMSIFFLNRLNMHLGALIDWKLKNNNKTQMTFLIYSIIGIDGIVIRRCSTNSSQVTNYMKRN